jgi:hypothetical protein
MVARFTNEHGDTDMRPSAGVERKSTARTIGWVGGAVLTVATAAGLALGPQEEGVGDNTFRVYRDAEFQGKDQVIHPVTSEWSSRLHVLDKKLRDKVSSVEWNLPRGVVVVFYDHTNGTGRQLAVWGSGRRGSLEDADFKKRAAAWAWAYVDGWEEAPSEIRRGFSARPLMTTQSKDRIAENTLELHKDFGARDKGKDLLRIESVTDKPQGVPQPITGPLDNKVTSLRWNLPPGIVVVLYDKADGTGQRMPLWGDGEMSKLRAIDNRTSAWAWYDLVTEESQ